MGGFCFFCLCSLFVRQWPSQRENESFHPPAFALSLHLWPHYTHSLSSWLLLRFFDNLRAAADQKLTHNCTYLSSYLSLSAKKRVPSSPCLSLSLSLSRRKECRPLFLSPHKKNTILTVSLSLSLSLFLLPIF